MEILRDPIWVFASAIIGFLAVVVPVLLSFRERRRKRLAYQVVSETLLISIKEQEELKDKLKIFLNDQLVSDLDIHAVIITIVNTGNVPCTERDYAPDGSITFEFSGQPEILTAEVIQTAPDVFEAAVSTEKNTIRLEPVLLNVGQSITFKALIKHYCGFTVRHHIEGTTVTKLAETSNRYRRLAVRYVVAAVIVAISANIVLNYFISRSPLLTINITSGTAQGLGPVAPRIGDAFFIWVFVQNQGSAAAYDVAAGLIGFTPQRINGVQVIQAGNGGVVHVAAWVSASQVPRRQTINPLIVDLPARSALRFVPHTIQLFWGEQTDPNRHPAQAFFIDDRLAAALVQGGSTSARHLVVSHCPQETRDRTRATWWCFLK